MTIQETLEGRDPQKLYDRLALEIKAAAASGAPLSHKEINRRVRALSADPETKKSKFNSLAQLEVELGVPVDNSLLVSRKAGGKAPEKREAKQSGLVPFDPTSLSPEAQQRIADAVVMFGHGAGAGLYMKAPWISDEAQALHEDYVASARERHPTQSAIAQGAGTAAAGIAGAGALGAGRTAGGVLGGTAAPGGTLRWGALPFLSGPGGISATQGPRVDTALRVAQTLAPPQTGLPGLPQFPLGAVMDLNRQINPSLDMGAVERGTVKAGILEDLQSTRGGMPQDATRIVPREQQIRERLTPEEPSAPPPPQYMALGPNALGNTVPGTGVGAAGAATAKSILDFLPGAAGDLAAGADIYRDVTEGNVGIGTFLAAASFLPFVPNLRPSLRAKRLNRLRREVARARRAGVEDGRALARRMDAAVEAGDDVELNRIYAEARETNRALDADMRPIPDDAVPVKAERATRRRPWAYGDDAPVPLDLPPYRDATEAERLAAIERYADDVVVLTKEELQRQNIRPTAQRIEQSVRSAYSRAQKMAFIKRYAPELQQRVRRFVPDDGRIRVNDTDVQFPMRGGDAGMTGRTPYKIGDGGGGTMPGDVQPPSLLKGVGGLEDDMTSLPRGEEKLLSLDEAYDLAESKVRKALARGRSVE